MNAVSFIPWIPRRLHKVIGAHWCLTGKWGWGTPVFKVTTFWREVYYVSPEDLFAMETFKHIFSSEQCKPTTTKPAEAGSEGQPGD